MFVDRHRHCDVEPFKECLNDIILDALDKSYLEIGACLLGEIAEQKVLCMLHESEPMATASGDDEGEADNIGFAVMTVDEAHEAFDLTAEQVLAMSEQCPYIIFAIDGIRYIRELGWGEIAETWQRSIKAIAEHLAVVHLKMN